MTETEVVVVGAGVAGLATAWRLAEAGRSVVLLERFAPGHDRGSSHGATRIFRFAYDDPVYVRLARAALPLWRELEATSGRELLRVTGGLDLGPGERLAAIHAALRSCGARAELLDPAETRARFGWLEAAETPAMYSPDTGVLAAARSLDALADAARRRGAEIRYSRRVLSIEPSGDSVAIATDAGEIRARGCVVAAGAWSARLLEPLGVRLPVRVTREQVFYFRGGDDTLPFIHHGGIARYSVPAFAEAPGVKVAEHMAGEETSGDGRSFEMDPEGAARVAAYVERTLPSLDREPIGFETCLYATTPDEGFVLDRVGRVVVASACSGHGFKFGPAVGAILAALATGDEPPFGVEKFSLSRFAG